MTNEVLGILIGAVGVAIGVVSLAIAAILHQVTMRVLVRVKNGISTRYLDSFPKHLDEIVYLVNEATTCIDILADCVDYGSFRDPKTHAKLLAALSNALGRPQKRHGFAKLIGVMSKSKKAIPVRILVWGEPQLMSAANRFHRADERAKAEFGDSVRHFVKGLRHYQPDFVKQTQSEFDRLVAYAYDASVDWMDSGAGAVLAEVQSRLHAWVVTQLRQRGAEILGQYFSNSLPKTEAAISSIQQEITNPDLFFWIRDNRNAVLLLPGEGKDALAFATFDSALVTGLNQIFEHKLHLIEAAA